MNKTALAFVVATVTVTFVAGCAGEVEPEEGSSSPVAALPDEADDLAPATTNTGGGPSGCTTSKSCDRDYCCTTETCQFSTFITCVPAPKKTRTAAALVAQ